MEVTGSTAMAVVATGTAAKKAVIAAAAAVAGTAVAGWGADFGSPYFCQRGGCQHSFL